MKKVKILLLALVICLTFTGCSSFRISSIDDLISPVSPSGDDAGILAAVNEYSKGGYSIKIPSSGKYTTSFIFHDLNGDGNDEAIAFFEKNDNLGKVDMAVLSKANNSWSVIDNATGEGVGVNSVDFSDLNNDGTEEIIVCWGIISKSTTSNLCVYSTDKSLKLNLMSDSITAGEFISADINSDGSNELLVFNFGSYSDSPKAELYSFSSGSKELIGETKLDSSIISFSKITCGKTDEGMGVYADAIRANGASMVTELLYWSDYYDSIISPFYSYSTGKTSETSRDNMITSRDINGDGEIEIPVDKAVSGLPDGVTAQSWVGYESTVLKHRIYSYAVKSDGYLIALDDKLFAKAYAEYDSSKRELTITDGKKKAFSIITVMRTDYNSKDYSGYTEIISDSGLVYLCSAESNSDIKLTVDDIKNMFSTY